MPGEFREIFVKFAYVETGVNCLGKRTLVSRKENLMRGKNSKRRGEKEQVTICTQVRLGGTVNLPLAIHILPLLPLSQKSLTIWKLERFRHCWCSWKIYISHLMSQLWEIRVPRYLISWCSLQVLMTLSANVFHIFLWAIFQNNYQMNG